MVDSTVECLDSSEKNEQNYSTYRKVLLLRPPIMTTYYDHLLRPLIKATYYDHLL